MSYFFKILGILGLLTITRSIFIKSESKRAWGEATGGLLLLAYSLYQRDTIFIILQVIFIASNLYEVWALKKAEGQLPMPISNEEAIRLETGKNDN